MKFAISILKTFLFYFPGHLISGLLWLMTHVKWFESQMLLCELAIIDEALKCNPDNQRILDMKEECITMLETL